MRDLKASAIILIAYLVAGTFSLVLAIPPGFLAPVWIPGAIGLAAVLLVGYRALPGIAAGMILLTLPYGLIVLDAGLVQAVAGSVGLAAAAVLQAAIAKRLLRPGAGTDLSLETGLQLARLIGLGAVFAPMCGAALAAAWLVFGGFAPAGLEFLPSFLRNWVGNAVAAAALTPIILLVFAENRVSTARKRNVVLAFLILSLIGLAIFTLSRLNAIEQRQASFEDLVSEDHVALQERLNGARRRLQSIEGFFAASEEVSDAEFATFINVAFGQFDSVTSVHWLVVDAEGAHSSHQILGPTADLVSQTRRPIMVAADRHLLTDVYFDDLPRLIDQVLASGSMGVSALHGEDDDAWLALALPAFSGHTRPATQAARSAELDGVALGTFRLRQLTRFTFTHAGETYNHQIRGLDADGQTIWQSGNIPTNGRVTASLDLPIGDQRWQIDYVATDRFLREQQDWVSWAVIIVGLSFITLLNALALLSTARTDLVQRLVDEKTSETIALSRNLSLILEHAADAIMGLDGDGRGVLINPAAAKLLGYEADELTGKVVHDLIHPVDMQGQARTLETCTIQARDDGTRQQSGVERFRRKDGSDFFAEYTSETIRQAGGQSLGSVIVLRDISERIEIEADRERFIERLTRANEELERFAFVASHDLQEPLRLIANFNSLLASRYDDALDETGRTYIRHTLAATSRMQTLITDLLAYGRLNTDADMMKSDVDLEDLVQTTLGTLGPAVQAARERISIGKLPVVRGNPARLGQLFQNLIGNAVKFQPEGQDAEVTISARDLGPAWEISVTDNGIGIKRDYRDQIFQPFKRLHSPDAYPGSGMGLAICRKIVESHGGVITISDNEPHGSIFRFTLPKTAPKPKLPAGTEPLEAE